MATIRDVPEIDRPRERLFKLGSQALSDLELVAAMLGRGTRGREVMKLAGDVLQVVDRNAPHDLRDALAGISGIGPARAGQIVCSLEFARRRIREDGTKISKPADLVPLIRHYADKKQEHFLSISLNGAHEVVAIRCVSVGLVNCAQVHPREVFAEAISDRACSIIVAHNHPSGQLQPSGADIEVTKRLVDAGRILGIGVLDHIIIAPSGGFLSLRDEGTLEFGR